MPIHKIKAISGTIGWNDALAGYPIRSTDPDRDLVADTTDSAALFSMMIATY